MDAESSDGTTALIRASARRLLDRRLDEIVDRTVARTMADEPVYRGGPVSPGDLRLHMDRTMRLALIRVAGGEIPADLEAAALAVGTVRAQQGIPLASVLHAFRLDLKSLWEALIDEGRAVDAEQRSDFLERSSLMVWEAVELNTAEVVRGYQAALLSLEEARSAVFVQLLADAAPNRELVEHAAEVLGLPAQGHLRCVVGAFPAPRPDLVDDCAVALHACGHAFYFRWAGAELLGIVHVADDAADVTDLLGPLGGHVCTITAADGLGAVARAVRLGRMAVRGRAGVGVRRLNDTWLEAMSTASPELSEAIHAAVFSPLARLTAGERAGLVETVGDLTAHGGTIADIAARTYRHRNTVRARLRAFRTLTGFDLSRTGDLATVTIAFLIEARAA